VTRRAGAVLLAAIGLAACQSGPTAEEVRAVDLAACDAAGFEPEGDAQRLCLLLQATNRRLEALERRMSFIELDVRSAVLPFGRCIDRRC
jgi:hypothetical protein